MDLGLKGRHAFVTGASRGLGRAIAYALAAEGAEVTAAARTGELLRSLADSAAGLSGNVIARPCDLADSASIASLSDVIGRTDVLVLNTGGPPPGRAADISDDVWRQQFETMFLSVIRLTRLALPGMRERRFGRIILVVSSGVLQPIPDLGISNALRMALVGWAKTLAGEVASAGITVNCIAPGRIATDRVVQIDRSRALREGVSLEEVERQSRETIPVGRYGDASEFAAVAAFLASNSASYMTGGILRVDGGMIRSV
jgi:3-oxoacyl-[acyl-carrier protein] reductase